MLMMSKYCSFWGAGGIQYTAVIAYSVLRSHFVRVLYMWCCLWVNVFADSFIAKLLWRERTVQSMKWHSVSRQWSEWEALKQVSHTLSHVVSFIHANDIDLYGPNPPPPKKNRSVPLSKKRDTLSLHRQKYEVRPPFLTGWYQIFCLANGAFYKAGLALWNSLPLRIRQF